MAELDKIPQKTSVELETVKLEQEIIEKIKEINNDLNAIVNDFGQIYIRKKELNEELVRLDEILEKGEDAFKDKNKELKTIIDSLEEKYPRHQIDLKEGIIVYQPGAPSRLQQQNAPIEK
jgi:uncharacterized phage infection (PIP) family protein YhgE